LIDPDELGTRRLDLAEALRRLRVDAGLSGNRLAARVAMSQSKISKIENGRVIPTVLDVDRILKALNTPPDLAEQLLGLVRLANTEFHDVRSSLRRGLHKRQQELAGLEASAQHIRYFLPVMITGLLHIPEYARSSLGRTTADQSATIARRLGRQAILDDLSKTFTFLFTEAAVRWPLCEPVVMATQVEHLIEVAARANVTVGVIPLTATVAEAPLNTFTIYDDRMVTAETIGGLVVMRDPRDVELHREMFTFFAEHAVVDDPAVEILHGIAAGFRSRSAL